MLINEHSNWDAIHVEPIKEVLYVSLSVGIDGMGILQLHHTLSHRHDNICVPVPDLYQRVCEPAERKNISYMYNI